MNDGERFVIVGTGRSGTRYCAELFRSCGIRCGHQDVFRHEHTLGMATPVWWNFDGDSSFEAVPMLEGITKDGVIAVLVVRHPLEVVQSWLSLGVFKDTMSQTHSLFFQVLEARFPEVMSEPTPVARAARYYLTWNAAASRYSSAVIALSHLRSDVLFRLVNRLEQHDPSKTALVSRTLNSRWWDKDITQSIVTAQDLPSWFSQELKCQDWVKRLREFDNQEARKI